MLGTQPDTDSVLQAIDQISFEEGRGTETGKDSGVIAWKIFPSEWFDSTTIRQLILCRNCSRQSSLAWEKTLKL